MKLSRTVIIAGHIIILTIQIAVFVRNIITDTQQNLLNVLNKPAFTPPAGLHPCVKQYKL